MNYFDSMTLGVSVPLTKLASGYKPVGLIGNIVFPVVNSILSQGQIPVFSKDAFKMYETRRARLAKSNRADVSPDAWLNFACVEHDLAVPMDKQELDELDAIPVDIRGKAFFDIQNRTRRRVQWNMALRCEAEVATMVQATSSYPAGHYVTMANGTCWSEAGSTPIQDIETGREKIRSAIGVYPNAIFMGASAYETLKFHAQYQAIMKLTSDQIVTLEFIKTVHGFNKAIIGLSMALDSANALYDLWSDNVILAYIPDGVTPDLDEPSFGYTIRPKYNPKPYPYIDLFEEEGGKLINVRCTDKYDQLMIMNTAGYLIKNVKK